MDFLPIFMKVSGRVCLVVGGGEVALRKVEMLRRARAAIRVVAPAIAPGLVALGQAGQVELRPAAFEPEDLDGAAIVVAATDDRALNETISKLARLRGIPVNVVDDPELCTFIMPAIIDRAPVLVAVSTGGCSPVLARRVRALLEEALPQRLGDLAQLASDWRRRVKELVPDAIRRRLLWERAINGAVAARVEAGDMAGAEALLAAEIAAEQARGRHGAVPGDVATLDLGDRPTDLLTLRDLNLLRSADVIVHDAAVDPTVLDFARRDATRVSAGDVAGEIDLYLAAQAADGRAVLRITVAAKVLPLGQNLRRDGI